MLVFTTTGRIWKLPGTQLGDNSTWSILIFTWSCSNLDLSWCLPHLAATNQVPLRHFQIFKEVVSTLELWHEAADSLDRLQVGRGRDTNVVQTIDSRYRLGSLDLKKDVPNAGGNFGESERVWIFIFFAFFHRHCWQSWLSSGAAWWLIFHNSNSLRSGFTIQIQAQWYQDEPFDPELVDVFGSAEVHWMLHPTYQSAGGCPDVLQDPRLVDPNQETTQPERHQTFFAKQARCFWSSATW